jgi:membrane protein
MLRFAGLLQRAFWRALRHDALNVAKGAAFSFILTFFPALMVAAAVLATSPYTETIVKEIAEGLGYILPPGTRSAARAFFETRTRHPTGLLVSASLLTLFAASGVMLSWMEGFRKAYDLPRIWGFWKEQGIAFLLVGLCFLPMIVASLLVAFGSLVETWLVFNLQGASTYIFFLWTALRLLISVLTSIAVITLVYHYAIPRTLPWHSVLPGAVLATVAWLIATAAFGWYVKNYALYNVIYGSLGAAIALLVWMYIVCIIILVGAEFNALVYPRPFERLQERAATVRKD